MVYVPIFRIVGSRRCVDHQQASMARGKHSKRRETQDSSVASSVEARGLKLRPVEARLPPSFLLHHLHHISAIRQINALRCPHFILPGRRQLPLSVRFSYSVNARNLTKAGHEWYEA